MKGQVKIWDLQAPATMKKSADDKFQYNLLLKSVINPPPQTLFTDRNFFPVLVADEFQIIIAMQYDNRSSYLYAKTYLAAPI